MLIMTKETILQKIRNSLDKEKENKSRTMIGILESYYKPFFLVGMCFTDSNQKTVDESELPNLTENELNNLITLAEYAADAFYLLKIKECTPPIKSLNFPTYH